MQAPSADNLSRIRADATFVLLSCQKSDGAMACSSRPGPLAQATQAASMNDAANGVQANAGTKMQQQQPPIPAHCDASEPIGLASHHRR